MRIIIRNLAKDDVLAGASNGAVFLAQIIELTSQASPSAMIYLDFQSIRVATSSFLRVCILGFRDYCRRRRPDLCPVICNAVPDIVDELSDLLQRTRDALVICNLTDSGRTREGRLLGILEEKQRTALVAIISGGETDAATLSSQFLKTDPIGITGWNNRLAALAAKGILRESKIGRTKRFRPVVEDLSLGT